MIRYVLNIILAQIYDKFFIHARNWHVICWICYAFFDIMYMNPNKPNNNNAYLMFNF